MGFWEFYPPRKSSQAGNAYGQSQWRATTVAVTLWLTLACHIMLQPTTLTLVFHMVLRNYSPHHQNDNDHNMVAFLSLCGLSWLVGGLVQENDGQQSLGLIALWDIPFWLCFIPLVYTKVSGAHVYFPLTFLLRHRWDIWSRNILENLTWTSIQWNCWTFSGDGKESLTGQMLSKRHRVRQPRDPDSSYDSGVKRFV